MLQHHPDSTLPHLRRIHHQSSHDSIISQLIESPENPGRFSPGISHSPEGYWLNRLRQQVKSSNCTSSNGLGWVSIGAESDHVCQIGGLYFV